MEVRKGRVLIHSVIINNMETQHQRLFPSEYTIKGGLPYPIVEITSKPLSDEISRSFSLQNTLIRQYIWTIR